MKENIDQENSIFTKLQMDNSFQYENLKDHNITEVIISFIYLFTLPDTKI